MPTGTPLPAADVRTEDQSRRSVVGMTLVTLLIIGGLVLWQVRSPAAPPVVAPSVHALGQRSVTPRREEPPSPPVRPTTNPDPAVVYLVSTEEEAAAAREALANAGAFAPRAWTVVVVASADDEQRLQRAINEAHVLRGAEHLGPTKIIDLR